MYNPRKNKLMFVAKLTVYKNKKHQYSGSYKDCKYRDILLGIYDSLKDAQEAVERESRHRESFSDKEWFTTGCGYVFSMYANSYNFNEEDFGEIYFRGFLDTDHDKSPYERDFIWMHEKYEPNDIHTLQSDSDVSVEEAESEETKE